MRGEGAKRATPNLEYQELPDRLEDDYRSGSRSGEADWGSVKGIA